MAGTVTKLPQSNPKKSGGKKKKGKEGEATAAIKDLKAKARSAATPESAESALAAIVEIQKTYNKWVEAKAKQKKVGFECKEKADADEAALKAAIEEELPIEPHERDAKGRQKLELIEMRWQEYEETKAHNVEARKAAKEHVQTTLERFTRALGESSQLTLPHTG